VRKVSPNDDYFLVEVEELLEPNERSVEIEALMRSVHQTFENYVKLNKRIPPEMLISVQTIDDPARLADTIVAALSLKLADKQGILETESPTKRLEKLFELMQAEIEILQVEKKIRTRVKKQMEKTQKEYYLNEQMQAIQKELGERDEFKNEIQELEEKIKNKKMSKEAHTKVRKELKKLKMMSPMSAEATVVRNYIDWVLSLPWEDKTQDKLDVAEAEKILDQDHYGLQKVKERILEYLAVQALVNKLKGPNLVPGRPARRGQDLAGQVDRAGRPDGGSVAAVARRRTRRGGDSRAPAHVHRRGLPGKIIQSAEEAARTTRCSCSTRSTRCRPNFRGDPSAALLEVLESRAEQQLQRSLPRSRLRPVGCHVHHHRNSLHSIPVPLQDRMEIISCPATPSGEGVDRRAVPAPEGKRGQRGQGRRDRLRRVIGADGHPSLHERGGRPKPGARDLDGPAQDRQGSGQAGQGHQVQDHAGQRPEISRGAQVPLGQARGARRDRPVQWLAVTMHGGDILPSEVTVLPGKGKVTLTGKLGDVMQESAHAAMSYIRSRAESLGLERDFYARSTRTSTFPRARFPRTGRRRA